MTAYLLVDLDIHDQEGFQAYRTRTPEFIAKHGGEFLVKGGEFEVIEGDWKPNRLVLFKFPNRQAIRNQLQHELAQVQHGVACQTGLSESDFNQLKDSLHRLVDTMSNCQVSNNQVSNYQVIGKSKSK